MGGRDLAVRLRPLPTPRRPRTTHGRRPARAVIARLPRPLPARHRGHRRDLTLRIAGQLRHVGVGRTYARTPVILLVQDLHVRVVDAATGELIREAHRRPQQGLPTKEHPEMNNTQTCNRRSGCRPMS